MKPIHAAAPLLALLLAACGGDSGEAAAGGGLTQDQCGLLVDRHVDYALSVAPPDQAGMMQSMMDAGRDPMIEECLAGGMFDREAYDCVSSAAEGSDASHACIVAAHERG